MKLHPIQNIAIIAPGYGASARTLKAAEDLLAAQGFKSLTAQDLLGEDPLHSHNDASRTRHLIEALTHPDVHAIWALKGGYGSAKLIPALASFTPPEKQKLLIGFSDITALHLYFTQQWGWQSLHAPVLWQAVTDKINTRSLKSCMELLHGKTALPPHVLTPLNAAAEGFTSLQAKLTGGNLKLLQCSISTPWQLQAEGKILIVEDVDEQPYQLDRMMLHLEQSNRLRGVKAIIFGTFHSAKTQTDSVETHQALARIAAQLHAPVFKTESFGHGQLHLPLLLGADYAISQNANGCSLTAA